MRGLRVCRGHHLHPERQRRLLVETRREQREAAARISPALANGKPIGVYVRTPAELDAIIERNPFKQAEPNRLLVMFLDRAPQRNILADLAIPGREEIRLSGREAFVHCPDGIGRSKLRLPFAKDATGRNLNTVRKLLALGRVAQS